MVTYIFLISPQQICSLQAPDFIHMWRRLQNKDPVCFFLMVLVLANQFRGCFQVSGRCTTQKSKQKTFESKQVRLWWYKWVNFVFFPLPGTRQNKNVWTETFRSWKQGNTGAVFLSASAVGDFCGKVWQFYIYAANYKNIKLLNWGK